MSTYRPSSRTLLFDYGGRKQNKKRLARQLSGRLGNDTHFTNRNHNLFTRKIRPYRTSLSFKYKLNHNTCYNYTITLNIL